MRVQVHPMVISILSSIYSRKAIAIVLTDSSLDPMIGQAQRFLLYSCLKHKGHMPYINVLYYKLTVIIGVYTPIDIHDIIIILYHIKGIYSFLP